MISFGKWSNTEVMYVSGKKLYLYLVLEAYLNFFTNCQLPICRLIASARNAGMKGWRTPHNKPEGLMRGRLFFTAVSSAGQFLLSCIFLPAYWLVLVCEYVYVRCLSGKHIKNLNIDLKNSEWRYTDSLYWVLPVCTSLSNLDLILRSQQFKKCEIANENCIF